MTYAAPLDLMNAENERLRRCRIERVRCKSTAASIVGWFAEEPREPPQGAVVFDGRPIWISPRVYWRNLGVA